MASPQQFRWLIYAGVAAVLVYVALNIGTPPSTDGRSGNARVAGAEDRIAELFREQRSGVVVEGSGTVQRLLEDDRSGSEHQRFILALDSGLTLLVSHNIDLAPRLDALRPGDRVEFRGQYEWNERGGVLHWTHHDPGGRRPGGWLRSGGRTYR